MRVTDDFENNGSRTGVTILRADCWLALTPEEGMLILDVVGEAIACVEILDRDDVREKLDAVLP